MKVIELEVREGQVFYNSETKECVEYTAYVATIGGLEVRFYPKKEDKKLLEYLLRSVEDV